MGKARELGLGLTGRQAGGGGENTNGGFKARPGRSQKEKGAILWRNTAPGKRRTWVVQP